LADKPSNIITLTTDYGVQDFYAGALKGTLLRHCPQVQLVDISHQIPPFDIVQGAFVVQEAFPAFPEGTLHCVAINCLYASGFRFVALRHRGHFFIAPDNGILTLIFSQPALSDVRVLPVPGNTTTGIQVLMGKAAAHLHSQPFDTLGLPGEPLYERITLQPVITPTRIRATVMYVDNFENAILNLRRDDFERVAEGRKFTLLFKRLEINQLSENYCDVPIGDPLCRFNDANLLEISVHMGRAATLLGLQKEETVEIVFV
jgi:S-adenosyl-L-methionine hydrolase (adenosine-forming)